MNEVFKDLYTFMKGKKSVFKFLNKEDLKNLKSYRSGT